MSACRDDGRQAGALLLLTLLAGCQAEPPPALAATLAASSRAAQREHRLLRFGDAMRARWRRGLAERGVVLRYRRGHGWWLADGAPRALDALGACCGVTAQRRILAEDKLSARLRRTLAGRADDERLRLWIVRAPSTDDEGGADLVAQGARRVGFAPIFELRWPTGAVLALAALDDVLHVDLAPPAATPSLDEARAAIGVDALQRLDLTREPPAYALSGQGTAAAIWDPDGVDASHEDLADTLLRAPDPALPNSLSHGTAVAGCLAGSGARSAAPPEHPWAPLQLRGMAPRAKVAMYLTETDRDAQGKPFPFVEQYLQARQVHRVDVVSLSFSHQLYATYDAVAMNLDYVLAGINSSLPSPVPFVVAAGNEGQSLGYGSVSAFASGKNTLAVGASDAITGALAGFSSHGPTADGRLKPEVVAPGTAAHGATRVGLDGVRVLGAAGEAAASWSFDGSAEGWTIHNDLEGLAVSGGVLAAQTTGDNPSFASPEGLGLDAATHPTVEITMRLDHHHQAELLWKTVEEPSFHHRRMARFFVNADGVLHTYRIELAEHPGWVGTIEQLRVDPLAPGLVMPAPGNTYVIASGTSMSAPIVAGGLLLLVEAWRDAFGATPQPTPALFRALLVATARDMVGEGPAANPDLGGALTPYPEGPDNATGFGEVRFDRAVALISQAGAGAPQSFFEGALADPQRPVRLRLRVASPPPPALSVTLAWDDPPGAPGAPLALQNDLELRVTTPQGETLLPWRLDPARPEAPASRGEDHLNNLEQVPLTAPAAGDHVITVSAHELLRWPQAFALALSSTDGVAALAVDGDDDGAFADDDCDDADPRVFPGATEIEGNGVDDDCDPATPDAPPAPDAGAAVLDAGAPAADVRPTVEGARRAGGCSCTLGDAAQDAAAWWLLLLCAVLSRARTRRRGS